MYITSHIFWASPCKKSNQLLLPDNQWIADWCKLSKKETSLAQAEANYAEGASIALNYPNDQTMTRKAIDKICIAEHIYLINGDERQSALGFALTAGLYAKLGRYKEMIQHAKYAVEHLDKTLDKEQIENCKMLISNCKVNVETTNTAQNNKPHILITKPPIVVPIKQEEKYPHIRAKKRSETTKQSATKAKQPAPREKETDFVKAAVSGKLFRDEPDDSDT